MSWVASTEVGAAGGICDRHTLFADSPSMAGGLYSLNTLWITQVNHGEILPDGVASLSVTHELGHSFGCTHDEDWYGRHECAPGKDSPHGKYIMSGRASKVGGFYVLLSVN